MAFKIEWKPVLQTLALKEYHPGYGEEVIMVCVNPQPEFWQERQELLNEFARRMREADTAVQKASITPSDELRDAAEKAAGEFGEWSRGTFVPAIWAWFAKLWSFGEDTWTPEEVAELDATDTHLTSWLNTRSIDMINEHKSARKKA